MARPHRTASSGLDAVPAVSVGDGVLDAMSDGFAGRVEGVFDGGFYVSGSPQTVFAVLGPQSWAGPLHLVAEELPLLPARHDSVTVAGAVLAAGRIRLRVDPSRRWEPRLPARLSVPPAAWHGLVDRVDPDLAPIWGAVTGYVRRGDLAAAFRLLQGRGAGLTPSGDDVLAGILLVGAINPGCRPALDRLARSARTTALSCAYLRWAAAGQSIQPAHALLDAAAAGDRGRMARAARSLAAVGATSGRALVAGVALAATELPPTAFAPTMAPRPAVV